MSWRALMRRAPTKSFTVVGDVAQTSSAGGTDSWTAALSPYIQDRLQVEHLTVNYRTPRPITELANQLLESINPEATPGIAVRAHRSRRRRRACRVAAREFAHGCARAGRPGRRSGGGVGAVAVDLARGVLRDPVPG